MILKEYNERQEEGFRLIYTEVERAYQYKPDVFCKRLDKEGIRFLPAELRDYTEFVKREGIFVHIHMKQKFTRIAGLLESHLLPSDMYYLDVEQVPKIPPSIIYIEHGDIFLERPRKTRADRIHVGKGRNPSREVLVKALDRDTSDSLTSIMFSEN